MTALRVLVAGTWERGASYPRSRALVEAMRCAGFVVEELHVPSPCAGRSKATLVRSPWLWPGYALRSARTRRRLVRAVQRRLEEGPRIDLVLVPYPGHLAVRWIRRVSNVPVVLDLFLSAWSTAVEDRNLCPRGSLRARALLELDRRACLAADLVLLDTAEHVELVSRLTGVPRARFDWVPVGVADPGRAVPESTTRERLHVLFFGTGVSLHGVRHLCDAVARCDAVHLTFVGGSASERAHALRVVPPHRLELGEAFEAPERLQQRIAGADLVAGVFGTSEKAKAVVPFKIVHALAAARPVLTGDTPAIRRILHPEVDCLVAPCGDAAGIAQRLAAIAADRSRLSEIGEAGRRTFEARYSSAALGRRMEDVLLSVVRKRLFAQELALP